MLEEKLQPYIQNIDNEVLSEPILLKSQKQEKVHFLSLSLCDLSGFAFIDYAC